MPEISVIVPVYNTEAYLCRCVDSILAQTFTDFELILVDDGSTDRSGEICDSYACRDKRIRVIRKTNKGSSSARNAGLTIAKGKYILFCDSDDSVHKSWCETLLNTIESDPDAFISCDIQRLPLERNQETEINDTYGQVIELSYFQLYKRGLSGFSCNKIFCMEKIREAGLSFNEALFIGEDVEFTVSYCKKCTHCLLILKKLYYYWQNSNSVSHTYYWNLLELRLLTFRTRLPLIEEDELEEYCDIFSYYFINYLNIIYDSRNKEMPIWEKMRYNQQMISTEEFQFCLNHASLAYENPVLMRMLKKEKYYAFWLLEKAASIKHRIGGVFK